MEQWRKVPGYENYEISIETKEGKCRRQYKSGKTRLLSSKPNKDGRLYWELCKNNVGRNWQAARWIAITFPELVENKYFEDAEIDHKDTDPMNNLPSNLRWVTKLGNMRNPLTKKHYMDSREHLKNRQDCSKPVVQYTKERKAIRRFNSLSEVERELGFFASSISRCCRGKLKTAYGFVWRYAV